MLTPVLVCVGVMGPVVVSGKRVGGGFMATGRFKSVSKILLGKMVDSSFRWLLLVYSE